MGEHDTAPRQFKDAFTRGPLDDGNPHDPGTPAWREWRAARREQDAADADDARTHEAREEGRA